ARQSRRHGPRPFAAAPRSSARTARWRTAAIGSGVGPTGMGAAAAVLARDARSAVKSFGRRVAHVSSPAGNDSTAATTSSASVAGGSTGGSSATGVLTPPHELTPPDGCGPGTGRVPQRRLPLYILLLDRPG